MAITVSRRPEGFRRSHQNQNQARQAQQQHQQQPQQQQHQHQPPQHHLALSPTAGVARMKHPLDPIDNLGDALKSKRTRIAVEIFTRPLAHQSLGPSKSVLVRRQLSATQPVHVADVASSHKPERPSLATTNPVVPSDPPVPPVPLPTRPHTATTAPPPPSPLPPPPTAITPATIPNSPTTATSKEHGLTRHQEKVINGIRHELDRLQPSVADTGSAATTRPPGRKLRSQEATRFKSELAAYFPEYDEVIGNDPKEQHLLNVDTPIIVFDTEHETSDVLTSTTTSTATTTSQHLIRSEPRPQPYTVRLCSDRLFTDLQNSPIVHFDLPKTEPNDNDSEDPLPDSLYAPAHRKAERLEKSIRNTERGRAQHEKDQIIRLLGELQGQDWLRTMGVNGVTESRRKSFEPARDHFIKGCQAILDKFRLWSQEEKRRKLERERALAEETEEEEDEDEDEDDGEEEEGEEEEEEEDEEEEDADDSDCGEGVGSVEDVDMADAENENGDDASSDGEPPEYSDIDGAARQLHDEAMERARYAALTSPKRTRGEPPPPILDLTPREFTSFFDKKHQRDAALNKDRRRGRTVLAWGHPVPEGEDCDFELPDFCLDEDTLKAHARQKRRDRRQRKQ